MTSNCGFRSYVVLLPALLLLGFTACGRHDPRLLSAQKGPAKLSAADLTKLRWIEGSWRGSGVDQAPFFERYRFENDTTLLVDSFPDEKLEKVEDTSRYELKDGQFGNGSYVLRESTPKELTSSLSPGRPRIHFVGNVCRLISGRRH